jgi:hypothetical protein
MSNIFDMPEYVDTVYISDVKWLLYTHLFINKLVQKKISTIYIAPKELITKYEKELDIIRKYVPVEIIPFSGGFKLNSITLFAFNTKEDLVYFTKITELRVGKYGTLI